MATVAESLLAVAAAEAVVTVVADVDEVVELHGAGAQDFLCG